MESKICSVCQLSFHSAAQLAIHRKKKHKTSNLFHDEVVTRKLEREKEKEKHLFVKKKIAPLFERYQEKVSVLILKVHKKRRIPVLEGEDELSKEIWKHYWEARPSKARMKIRKELLMLIYDVLKVLFEGEDIKMTVYGSVAVGLDEEMSDVDVGLIIGKFFSEDLTILQRIEKTFRYQKCDTIRTKGTFNAKVPIVTITDTLSQTEIDLSLRSADLKLKIFKEYISIDKRTLPLLKFIKFWAKQRNIHNAYQGLINSFGYCCLAIAHLQNVEPPILPNLQNSKADEIESASGYSEFGSKNKESVGNLLITFFKRMIDFDYENKRVSIMHGGYLDKEMEKFSDNTLSDHCFIIEDPFEPYVNFSRHCGINSLKIIQREFERAYHMLKSGKSLMEVAAEKE